MEFPWDDMKVAFSCDDEDKVWEIDRSKLPQGWSINETDCSGARCVVIFRIQGTMPTVEDAQIVRTLINKATKKRGRK